MYITDMKTSKNKLLINIKELGFNNEKEIINFIDSIKNEIPTQGTGFDPVDIDNLIEVNKRFKRIQSLLMYYFNMSMTQFAQSVGFSNAGTLKNTNDKESANDKRPLVSMRNLYLLHTRYNVNINYILTGQGEIFNTQKSNREIKLEQLVSRLGKKLLNIKHGNIYIN